MDYSVKIKNLTVTLGNDFKALKNINLELPIGKTIGFIGPSGAGKTTLIRAIVGSLKINSGEVRVFNLAAGSALLREQISYMTQELSVYSDLTVKENLKYFITMASQPAQDKRKILKDVLDLVDMPDKSDVLVRNLSTGQKQRVSLAISLIGSPKLIVLDEPTVGLDPVLRKKLWHLFNQLAAQGATLIISSHSMDEAEKCDDLVLIRNGKLITHSSPKEILRTTNSETIEESFLKLVGDKE